MNVYGSRARKLPAPPHVVWDSLVDPHRAGTLSELPSQETLLGFTLLTPHDVPDPSRTGHIRHRVNHLLHADLRLSYGQ